MTQPPALFRGFLGADYAALPPEVRDLHDLRAPTVWRGRASVVRGRSLWARLIAFVFRFPPATPDTSVTVTISPQNGGELWERQFGTARFWSFLQVEDGKMTERFGPFTFTLGPVDIQPAALARDGFCI